MVLAVCFKHGGLSVPDCCASSPRRTYWPFTDQHLGGDRQFHLVCWQALGGISAEEHAHIFLDEP